jgi:hypothetical protein
MRQEKDLENLRNNSVRQLEFIGALDDCVKRQQYMELSEYVTSLPSKDELF